jgi:pimeloyl-ACP methyl ester carboxylesterase
MNSIETKENKKLYYIKDGSGPAILLIHGFPESSSLWELLLPLLSSSYTVIAPDIPGAGASELPSDGVSMESIAESINDILEHECIEEALIAGHSMGGYAALAFAERYPEKVKGLSLIHSIASADNDEKKENRRKSIELIRKGGKEPFIKQMIPNLFSPTFKDAHPSVIEEQVKRGMELAAESMMAFTKAMMERPDRSGLLKDAEFPIQFIIGKEDGVIPPKQALAQSTAASCNFVSLYENTGHMSMIENVAELGNDLNEFAQYCYMK